MIPHDSLLPITHLCPSLCHTGLTRHICSPGLETSFTLISVIYAHYIPEAMVALHMVNQGIFLQWAWGLHFFFLLIETSPICPLKSQPLQML